MLVVSLRSGLKHVDVPGVPHVGSTERSFHVALCSHESSLNQHWRQVLALLGDVQHVLLHSAIIKIQ